MGVLHERRMACEMVATELYAGILNGEYQVGRPLPAERALARRFGVDRGTVREGLARLTARGLVSPRQGLGNWVCDPDDITGGEQLVDWFELSNSLSLCEAAARSLLELRTTFLVRAARRLARDITESELEDLEHYVKVMEFHLGRDSLRMTILEVELGFQERLVSLGGLAYSVGFGPYGKLARRYLYCFDLPETCPTMPVASYRALLEHLRRKDGPAAMATLDGAFDEYDAQVIAYLVQETKNRIAYRCGPGPRTTDWELELDRREQSRQYELVGPSNQTPPPWRTPRRDAVHTSSPHVLPAPMAPHGPLHYTSPERQREVEEMLRQYEEPPAPPPKPRETGTDPPADETVTDEREPDG